MKVMQRGVWSGLMVLSLALMGAEGCPSSGENTSEADDRNNVSNNNSGNNVVNNPSGQVYLSKGEVLYPEYTTFEALRDAHAKEATTPEAGVRFWFIALYQYMSGDAAERARGKQALEHLTIPLKADSGWERAPSYIFFVDRMATQPYIFTSYAKGATPQNNYAIDYQRFELNITKSQQDSTGRGWQLFIQSGGADSPRPMYMKQSEQTGLWYVSEFNNMYVDIRKPVDPNAETFK